ncbi:MAG: shikimate dehydrogenase [Candidatus Methylumidiphilus sp.]
MMTSDRYAVFGHPISHSQSPRIHTLFAEQTGQAMCYTAEDVPAERFPQALRQFAEAGGKGLSCTVPLKELAWRIAQTKSQRAERAKAVNTLKIGEDGQWFGDNTDGVGLLRDLTGNLRIPLQGRAILLLGAGGASRGILQPLLAEHPKRLVIANRTVARAEALAAEFADLAELAATGFDRLEGQSFDLILNATAASLSGDLPPLPPGVLNAGGACYDLAYGRQPTAFVRWGERLGAAISVDGIGMLVEQAAEAFFIWRGIYPQTQPVIAQLNADRGLQP